MGNLNASTDFSSTYFNPVYGRCGLPVSFTNITDFDNVTLITFTRTSSIGLNDIKILSDPNLTYVEIGTAIANSYQIVSAGFTYDVTGVGTAYGYDNVIEIEYTGFGGYGDPSFTIETKGPFVFKVITQHTDSSNFKAILATLSNPDLGDYLLINPPGTDYSIEMTHIWNYETYEYKLITHRVYPNFKLDLANKTWDVVCDVDLAMILRNYLTIKPPQFNYDSDPTWIYKFNFEPDACKTITSYYAIVNNEQESRTQAAFPPLLNQNSYKLADYEIYGGHCRYPDNSFVPTQDYHKAGGSFVYPMKTDYGGEQKYSAYMCPGHTLFFYCYVPESTDWDMLVTYVAYDSENNILISDAGIEAYPTSGSPGIYYWEVGYLANALYDYTSGEMSRLNVQYRRDTGSYSTYPFDIYIKNTNTCEECGNGVQFAYLSSMGIYELITLMPSHEHNFEGKAVDISHEKRGFFSSVLHPERRFLHRNRGIVSEEKYKFYTQRITTDEYSMSMLMDFISSTDVYMIRGYGDLVPVRISPGNFIVTKGKYNELYEVEVTLNSNKVYTNNKF